LSLALSSANYQWFDQVGKKLQVKALAQLVMVKPVCIFIGDTGSPLFSLNFTKTQMTLQEKGATQSWQLDTAWFGGTPVLTVTPKDGGVDITLAGAFFPGTTIPASFRASISKTGMLRLRLKYGNFDAKEVPLSNWLKRGKWAQATVNLDLNCCTLGLASAVTVKGHGVVAFSPDWVPVPRCRNLL
jgi:hypothetical protein